MLDADGGFGKRGHHGVDGEAGPLPGVGIEGGIEIVAKVEVDAAQVTGWSGSEEVDQPGGFVVEQEVFDAWGVEVRGCFVVELFAVRLVHYFTSQTQSLGRDIRRLVCIRVNSPSHSRWSDISQQCWALMVICS